MRTIYWFYIYPKGYGQNLGSGGMGDSTFQTNYDRLNAAIKQILSFYRSKGNVVLPQTSLVLHQSSYDLASWHQNLGQCLREDLSPWKPSHNTICVVFAQGMGGFAGSYDDGLAVVGDYCIDAICERFFTVISPNTNPWLASVQNQIGSVAHELGHQWFGREHILLGDNIMGGGIGTFPQASLNVEQVGQLRGWVNGD